MPPEAAGRGWQHFQARGFLEVNWLEVGLFSVFHRNSLKNSNDQRSNLD